MKSFTTLYNLYGSFTQNTSTTNTTLGKQMINDAHRYLLQKYFNNEFTDTALTVAQRQFYPTPANFSKMKTVTITIGNLKWTPTEVLTRRDWDRLNVFPYYSDIPVNYFIYNNNTVGIWPIPSTAGNTITYNYKIRVPEMTFADYTTGSITVTSASSSVAGAGTTWATNFLPGFGSAVNLNLYLQPTPPKGDNNWYQIASMSSDTALILSNVYQSANTTQSSVSYTIGQMPLLLEDFHDLLVYRPLIIYFSSVKPDQMKAKQFRELYAEGEEKLSEYSGTRSVNVNLSRTTSNTNPNLFFMNGG